MEVATGSVDTFKMSAPLPRCKCLPEVEAWMSPNGCVLEILAPDVSLTRKVSRGNAHLHAVSIHLPLSAIFLFPTFHALGESSHVFFSILFVFGIDCFLLSGRKFFLSKKEDMFFFSRYHQGRTFL